MRREILITLLALTAGTSALEAQYSTTRISTTADGAQFYVDGNLYVRAAVFTWPAGSKHTITTDPNQDGVKTGTVFVFQKWADNTGQLNLSSPTVVLTADAKITDIVGTFSTSYALTLNYFACDGSPAACVLPGTVYINQAAYQANTVLFVSAGSVVQLNAQPSPGFVFLGWNFEFGQSQQAFLIKLPMNGPTQVTPRFALARQVTLATNPPDLRVTADRTEVITPFTYDWAVGTKHVLGAPASQLDISGKKWVLSSWDFGGSQNAVYTVGAPGDPVIGKPVNPPVTVTANFVRAVQASFLTNPTGMKIKVDARDNWPSYNFVWGIGEKHSFSAPADQVDAQGRHWAFQGWSNGGKAAQDVVMDDAAADNGFRITGTFLIQGQLKITSSPLSVTVQMDGTTCSTPCVIDRAPGTQVRLSVPANIQTSDTSRLDLDGWSDGGSATRTYTFGSDAANLAISYSPSFRLSASATPPDGFDFVADPPSPDSFYRANSTVALTAVARPGFKFRRWTGDSGTAYPTSTLQMSAPRSLVALGDAVSYIAPSGIRNAAGVTPEAVVAAGSQIAVYGLHLAAAYQAGPASPLAQSLGGTAVRVGDRVLPLLFVSPEQVNAVLPDDLAEGDYQLTVQADGLQDAAAAFHVVRNAPGLFARPDSDQSLAVALHEDGTAISAGSPARRGETIALAGTGFGPYDQQPPQGFAVPASPAFNLLDPIEIWSGDNQLPAAWAGAAPGLIATAQVKFKVTDDLASGPLPVRIRVNGRESNTVFVPVQ